MSKVEISQTQLAYIAGVIDGEGCFSLSPQNAQRNGYIIADVSIYQAKIRLLYYIVALIGPDNCSIYSGKTKRISALRFKASCLIWLLPMLIPHLFLKKEHAELMLKFLTIRKARVGRKPLTDAEKFERIDMCFDMKELNAPPSIDDGPYLN